ncbi:MAG: L-ribulose-5-phosphate 4-epimerase [Ardenticatenaceae bacterium]|nr:L-ribulose-5-phosphate 4-epimerase [Ardenticatenaceae bacterium]
MLEQLKEQLWELHLELPKNGLVTWTGVLIGVSVGVFVLELPKNGLVTWTGGNASARDPETGLVVIKPSGVMYEDLRPEDHVVLTVDGEIVEGALKPSSDTASHLYIYRHRPDVNSVVHTHSAYATAFAALGRPIPVFLTAIADEFGGPIPCAGFALIGGEEIGQQVVEHIGTSPAVLLKNHGVFTVGPTATAAVKAAVMVEDIARAVWLALQLGQPDEIPAEDVAKLHHRYTHVYGQR